MSALGNHFTGVVEKFLPNVVCSLFVGVEISVEKIRKKNEFDNYEEDKQFDENYCP